MSYGPRHTAAFEELPSNIHPRQHGRMSFHQHVGSTILLPSSPAPSIGSNQPSDVSTTWRNIGYLPQEDKYYSTGRPLFYHYREAPDAVVNREVRFKVSSAAKSFVVKDEDDLLVRRKQMLQIFTECFPADDYHVGSHYYASSTTYDYFKTIGQMANRTIAGTQVAYYVDDKDKEYQGNFIDSQEYQTLYSMLKQ